MKIGVYFNRGTFNRIREGKILNELKYLVQEGLPLSIEFFVFCPFGIEWWNKKINGLGFCLKSGRWIPEKFDLPDAVYDRATFPVKEKEIGHEVRNILRKDYNILFLNTKGYFDKWETHRVLSHCMELKKYLPSTSIYNHPLILDKFLNRYKTIYIKDSGGRLGRDIFKIGRDSTGRYVVIHQRDGEIYKEYINLKDIREKIINGRLNGKAIIIQQGINLAKFQGKPFDIRILVQKNGLGKWELVDKSIRIAAADNSVVTNISSGGEARPFDEIVPKIFPMLMENIEKEINMMSLNVCRCLERRYGRLGELGIDAAIDNKGNVWLLEINGKPAKSCIHNSNNPELIHHAYSNIVKYFKYLYERNVQRSETKK